MYTSLIFSNLVASNHYDYKYHAMHNLLNVRSSFVMKHKEINKAPCILSAPDTGVCILGLRPGVERYALTVILHTLRSGEAPLRLRLYTFYMRYLVDMLIHLNVIVWILFHHILLLLIIQHSIFVPQKGSGHISCNCAFCKEHYYQDWHIKNLDLKIFCECILCQRTTSRINS